jgi:hypothetical protein
VVSTGASTPVFPGWISRRLRHLRIPTTPATPPWNTPDPDNDSFDHDDNEQAQAQASEAQRRLQLVAPSAMDWRGAELDLVKGLLGRGMMALIYGESGSGKTLIAISLAMHVALGRPWCGRPVTKGFVVYLAPEGGHSVHRRFHAWCRESGISPKDNRTPFRTVPVRVDLCRSDADLEAVIANIHEAEGSLGRCSVLLVDTVSRALAGADENAPGDMGKFVGNCDRLREELGAAIVAVHHTPKGGDTPRGHSALKNGADVRLRASRLTKDLFELQVEHVKDGESGDQFCFSLSTAVVGHHPDGSAATGAMVRHSVIAAAGAPGRPQRLTERQLRVLQALRREADATGKWEHTVEEFNTLCDRCGAVDSSLSEGRQRGLRSDLKVQLANRKYIAVDGDRVRLLGPGQAPS